MDCPYSHTLNYLKGKKRKKGSDKHYYILSCFCYYSNNVICPFSNKMEIEAKLLTSTFQCWYIMVERGELMDYDFVGLYILAYLGVRRPRKWISGKLLCAEIETEELKSSTIGNIPYITDLLSITYLAKHFGENFQSTKIISIFNQKQLCGIKKNSENFVNKSLVHWALGHRPFNLITHIPSPMEVLRMQSRGTRVITSFIREHELLTHHVAKLTYMDDNKIHARDAFEFLVHDMKHMEIFIDDNIFLEQVGFFMKILSLHNGKPKQFFKQFFNCQNEYENIIFIKLWNELEYLISDM